MKARLPLEALFDVVSADADTTEEAIATAIYLVRTGAVEIADMEQPTPTGPSSRDFDLAA